jgi:hypothetical protein
MKNGVRQIWTTGLFAAVVAFGSTASAQGLTNPYRLAEDWLVLPEGRQMGAAGDLDLDVDGQHIWAVIRCDAGPEDFGHECLDSDLDPIVRIEIATGRMVFSMGGGLFIWPHGLEVDAEGNVWVTDSVRDDAIPEGDGRGHVVHKFSPDGEVLMTLGTPGEAGDGERHFDSPADVVVSSGGNVFVADGHWADGNGRVVEFSPSGQYLDEWGTTGYGPGEFGLLHALAIDARDRIYVADRPNARIQIFDTDGNHISTWRQFGTPSGIFVDADDKVYVADSESDWKINPGWEVGIRIGDARTGWVREFIRFPWADPRHVAGSGAEFVVADSEGNVYAGEPFKRTIRKYYRVDAPRRLDE